MSELAEFLTARYDEREQIALAAGGGHWQSGCRQVTHDDCDNRMGDCERIYGPDMTIYASGGHTPAQAAHIALNDPAQALREVEAGRKILALHKPDRNPADQWYGHDVRCEECGGITGSPAIGERGFNRSWPCQTLRAAVSVFSNHPGYKPEWGS